MRPFTVAPGRIAASVLLTLLLGASAVGRMSDWNDIRGTRFRGEPTEILGPFALFRTPSGGGNRVLLRGIPHDETLRFFHEIAEKAPPADHWADARGLVTASLRGRVSRVVNKHLEPATLTDVSEPELLLVLAGSPGNGESWRLVENMRPLYRRLERVLHGRVATAFVGVRQSETDYRNFVTGTGMPWLIVAYDSRSSLGIISHLVPPEGAIMLLISRQGSPLLAAAATDLPAIKKFTDELLELTWAINPENPRGWKDRAQYLSVVRPVEFAASSTEPLLLGNPLTVDGLRKGGVQRISAHVQVAANGAVRAVTLQPDSIIPALYRDSLVAALRQHLQFLPAIDHGRAVEGETDYQLTIPPVDPEAEADAMWLGAARGELPLADWMVLRPIHVPQSDFGEIDHVDETGKIIMKPLEVTHERVSRQLQRSAFNSDWFGPNGAGSVYPKEGDVQPVDDEKPVWHKLAAVDGLVDLAQGFANSDYCVGYAWTEFEVPHDMDAWLGIGSDDGLKIWHNGILVADHWIRRPSRIDDDVVPLHLKKGKNQLLIKIQNMTIDWSFICRLRTR